MKIFFISFMLILSSHSFGNLDPETGNNFIEFVDNDPAQVEGTPLLRRYYNSMTNHRGLFGIGWASDLETRLDFFPDGSVAFIPYGAGRIRIFEKQPFKIDPKWELPEQEATRKNLLTNLLNNKVYRYQWMKDNGYLLNQATTENVTITSAGETLICKKAICSILDSSGEVWRFDNNGRLTSFILEKGGEWQVVWKNEQPYSLKNISFEFLINNADGMIHQISLKKGNLNFKYQNGLLMESEDTKNNRYFFAYSGFNQLTNLKGKEIDQTYGYHPVNGKLIKMIINGEETTIEYDEKKELNFHKYTTIIKAKDGIEKLDYHYLTNDKGRYLSTLRELKGNNLSETTFGPNRKVLKITGSDKKEEFIYDSQDRVIEIKVSGRTTEKIQRDPKSGKILEIQDESSSRKYTYNPQGKIQSVLFNNGTALTFTYNHEDLIQIVNINSASVNEGKIELTYQGRRVKEILLNGKKPLNSTDKLVVARFFQLIKKATEMPSF